MTVACPSCETVYRVPREQGDAARWMRCGQCSYAWSPSQTAAVLDLSPEDSVAREELDALALVEADALDADDPVPDAAVSVSEAVSMEAEPASSQAPLASSQAPLEAETDAAEGREEPDLPVADVALHEDPDLVDLDDPHFASRSPPRLGAHRITPAIARSLAGLALAVGLLGSGVALHARERVVAYQPRTASLFEAIGLPVNLTAFGLVAKDARLAAFDARHHLTVTVTLTNAEPAPRAMPALDLTLLDETGLALVRHPLRVPSGPIMGLGETSFEARVDLDRDLDPTDVADAIVTLSPSQVPFEPMLSMIEGSDRE